ncbi:two-component system sensor histidine kinase NtrB [Paenibacillus donghaensis]|uniref:histidine kinase n=1 Tax=Paenibacillus donghaensis TaxID=414771 RepID=A0A2Z2KFJ6_9BACL|nr:ATP-binding protein [Paenibacillus donghaensis]ASA25526.1 hypothetical protein B9T62_35225 [Paenibacillus donghaensis]
MTRRNGKFPDDQNFLLISCALSVTCCSILSTTLFGVAYLNLAILPAFIGILYSSFRSGISLAAFFLFCNILFSEPAGLCNLVLNTGIVLYPLLFALAKPFKNGTLMEKIGLLWMVLLPGMLFVGLVPILDRNARDYKLNSQETLVITVYIFCTIVIGALFIYFIETAWDRQQAKEHMKRLSQNFLYESEKLQQITDVMPLSILSLDDNGTVTALNEFMLELIRNHYPEAAREDIVGKPIKRFFDHSVDEQVGLRLLDDIARMQRYNEKVTFESRSYLVCTAPLVHQRENTAGGMVLIVQDLTEEEKMRSELDNVERLTLVGQMAAGITHEIRNPMAVVRGFLQLMREKSPDELNSYYQLVMEELDRANSIINDFLSLAQSRVSHKERVPLHHIIEELSPLLWADANLRGQSVELRLGPALPLLELNVREIKQLILNLGRNSMEAMGAKGVLTLETRHTADRVELLVRDTGSGISESQREKLFTPFFTTKSQGTGLGLSLCLSIVERHEGSISVESQEGVGTLFTVSFPYDSEENARFAVAE